jgi:hypothetical protein
VSSTPDTSKATTGADTPAPRHSGWERFAHFWEFVEAASLHVPGVSTALFLGRRVGWKVLVLILLVVGGPIGEYSFLSLAVNRGVPRLAGHFGVTFESEGWSFHPFAFKAIVRDVRMRPEHDPTAAPVFTANEVEFQGSFGTMIRGLFEIFTLNPFHTFNEISVRRGELHLERTLTGHLNLDDLMDAVPEERKQKLSSGYYRINSISLKDFAINYIEHVSGFSGRGVIETTQANIHIDSIEGAVTNITPARGVDDMPTRIRVHGRSSDGLIDVDGKLGLTEDRGRNDGVKAVYVATDGQSAELRAGYHPGLYYEITVALHNIGAAAVARVVPITRIIATAGAVNGRVRFIDHAPYCGEAALAMSNVQFAPNPAVIPRGDLGEYQRVLARQTVNKPFEICSAIAAIRGDSSTGSAARAVRTSAAGAVAAAFNEQGTAESAPIVRRAVALDSQRLTGRKVVNSAVTDVTNQLAGQVGDAVARKLGPQTGQLVQQALTTTPTSGSTPTAPPAAQAAAPINKGAKSLGRSLKKFFTGDAKGK